MRRPAVVVLFVMTTAVVLCLLLVAHIRFYSSRSRLPESGNKVEKVLGVESVIEIRFDSAGIPHISALGESDLWFAVGYVHARERFFQMDLCRRLATGRLAEVFGESLLPSDRAMRTLRLGATAQAQSGMLSRSEIEVFEAYAAGVNAALDVWGRWIAPEVWLLGVDPVPWTVSDTLSIGVLFELGMTSAGREEVRRAHELTALGKDRALDLWGWSPEEARRWLPPQPDSLASVLSETALPGWPSSSNVWAIGPSRSVEGATLLGTSLSLPASMPTTGFALHLSSPGINVAGVGLPGTPAILVGHTEEVAWGISPVRLDDQDLFYLKVDDSRGRELIDGSWQPVRTVTEKITVREQKEPEIVKVSIAQSGPIIADDGRTVLALAWTGYHGPSSLTAFLQMNHANSVSGVATAWHDVIGPALHIVAADSDGQILHQVAGKVPIRRRGAGRLPAPGEYSQWAWQGFLSFSANPRALNPRDGWIAVAEHDLFLEGDFPRAKPFPADFVPPWQVRRLRDRLGRVDSWTAQMGLELQSDIVSGRAKALLQLLGPQLSHANGSSARSLLAWDGAMEVGETAPAIYARLLEELSKAVGTDEARAVSLPFNPIDSSRLILLLAGGINESWWDDVETSNVESREDIVGHVLSMLDSRPYERWGEIHQVRLSHVLGELPLLGGVLERILSRGPFAVPGDGTTLNSQPAMAQAPFDVVATQSLRFIAQPGRWDDAILVLSGGQSGRPWSPHYDDQIGPWLRAEPVRFVFSEGEVRIATGATLRLEPVAREQELE